MSFLERKYRASAAYSKSVQISLTFPSPERRAAVQQLLSDKAEIEGVNKGAIATGILERSLMPLSGIEKEIFLSSLPNGKNSSEKYPANTGIWKALELAFSNAHIEAGLTSVDYTAVYLKLATRLAWKYGTRIHEPIEAEDPRVNLSRDLFAIAPSEQALQSTLSENNPAAYPFFDFIEENWGDLKQNKDTFSFLVYLCAACENSTGTPGDRQELLSACATAQAERAQAQNDVIRRYEETIESEMVDIHMAGNLSLRIPGDWVLASSANACDAHYAGVIEVRNAPRAPHVVFFSNSPINSLTKEEEREIMRQAFKTAPMLQKYKEKEVPLRYNPDGGVANLREYNDSPKIGIFPILGSDMFSESNPAPYGAMIIDTERRSS